MRANTSITPRKRPPRIAPGTLPNPPTMAEQNALSPIIAPISLVTKKMGPTRIPAAAPRIEL